MRIQTRREISWKKWHLTWCTTRIGRVNTQSRSSGKEGSRNGATSGRTVIIIGPGKKCTRCKCRSLGLTVVPWVHRSLLATPLAGGYAYIHVVNLERCYEPFLLLVFRRVFHFRVQENRASERFPRLVNWFAGPPGLSESEKEEETRQRERERETLKELLTGIPAKIHRRKVVVGSYGPYISQGWCVFAFADV